MMTSGTSHRSISPSLLSSVRLATSGVVIDCDSPLRPMNDHCTSGSNASGGAVIEQSPTASMSSTTLQLGPCVMLPVSGKVPRSNLGVPESPESPSPSPELPSPSPSPEGSPSPELPSPSPSPLVLSTLVLMLDASSLAPVSAGPLGSPQPITAEVTSEAHASKRGATTDMHQRYRSQAAADK